MRNVVHSESIEKKYGTYLVEVTMTAATQIQIEDLENTMRVTCWDYPDDTYRLDFECNEGGEISKWSDWCNSETEATVRINTVIDVSHQDGLKAYELPNVRGCNNW